MAVLEREVRGTHALSIPVGAAGSLAGFREWCASDDYPEEGRICYLAGELDIDMGHEQIDTHVALKTAIARFLSVLSEEIHQGEFFGDGCRVVSEAGDISAEPDGCYVTKEAVDEGRVELQPSRDGVGVAEFVGAPDMVLEIVSPSSVRKDTKLLPDLYHRAGVREYWLIDARKKKISFQILSYMPDGYEPAPVRDGWLASQVFNREFRLDRSRGVIGVWKYTLQVRPLTTLPDH